MRLKSYPKMKDSGVEWIGHIPEHWEIRKLKAISKVTRLAGYEYTEYWKTTDNGEIIALRGQNIGFNKIDLTGTDRISEQLSKKLIRSRLFKNDLVFPCVGTIGNAAVIEEDDRFHINQNMAKISPFKEIDPYFLTFFLMSDKSRFQIDYFNSSGIQPSVLVGDLRKFKVVLPSFVEQKKISIYIKKQTSKIYSSLSKNTTLIELLKEKKQSLINQAVTKGLDPSVPMKDSELKWIGDIPKHWKTYRIKLLLESHKQGFYTEEEYVENGVKLLRITDIDDHANIRYDKCPNVSIIKKDHDIFSVKNNDFIFARSGTIGRFGLAKNPPDSVFASYLIRFRFKRHIPNFLKFSFLSNYFQEELLSSLHGGANKNIHANNIKEIIIAIPETSEEQKQIADFLDEKTSKIDSIIFKTELHIDKLQEYHQSLISSAVTGKIDVTSLV